MACELASTPRKAGKLSPANRQGRLPAPSMINARYEEAATATAKFLGTQERWGGRKAGAGGTKPSLRVGAALHALPGPSLKLLLSLTQISKCLRPVGC